MSDLQRHAWRFKFNGFPIYGQWEDGEDEQVIGYISEPEWKWHDLDDADKATVNATAAEYRADERSAGMTDDFVFWAALSEWAITCPHLHWTYHEPIFRECKACRTGEQLPGRRVRVGNQVLRVSDPPPRFLRIPVPLPTPTLSAFTPANMMLAPQAMQVDEYEWVGDHYRLRPA